MSLPQLSSYVPCTFFILGRKCITKASALSNRLSSHFTFSLSLHYVLSLDLNSILSFLSHSPYLNPCPSALPADSTIFLSEGFPDKIIQHLFFFIIFPADAIEKRLLCLSSRERKKKLDDNLIEKSWPPQVSLVLR